MSNITERFKSNAIVLVLWNNGVNVKNELLKNITISRMFTKDDKWLFSPNLRESDLDDVINVISQFKAYISN